MVNKMMIIGRLGGDPVQRETTNGKLVTSFSVATDAGWGDKKRTQWFNVSAWGKLAETCSQYLQKGRMVYVEGSMESNKGNEGKEYWNLNANEVRFLQGDQDNQEQNQNYSQDSYTRDERTNKSQDNYNQQDQYQNQNQDQRQNQGGYDGYGNYR